jgi:superfamily II helicase
VLENGTASIIAGIKAGCYHAGLSALSRTQVHEKWLKNQVHVICATIAFGSLFTQSSGPVQTVFSYQSFL